MEVSPELAHDTSATVAEAKRLWATIDRPNLMVKVPGTPEGIPAIQALIGTAINVNVTLLFGLTAYESAVQAYLAGLEDRFAAGGGISGIASVASVFVSRLDSAVESRLERSLHGKVAIANAKLIYGRSRQLFAGGRWDALAAAGARAQRLLWASTGTKNPALPELLYVEALIGADTVDTVPPATYEAFLAHGTVRSTLEEGVEEAHALLDSLPGHGVDLSEVLDQLLTEGVDKFSAAFRQLLSAVAKWGGSGLTTPRCGPVRARLPGWAGWGWPSTRPPMPIVSRNWPERCATPASAMRWCWAWAAPACVPTCWPTASPHRPASRGFTYSTPPTRSR